MYQEDAEERSWLSGDAFHPDSSEPPLLGLGQ